MEPFNFVYVSIVLKYSKTGCVFFFTQFDPVLNKNSNLLKSIYGFLQEYNRMEELGLNVEPDLEICYTSKPPEKMTKGLVKANWHAELLYASGDQDHVYQYSKGFPSMNGFIKEFIGVLELDNNFLPLEGYKDLFDIY